MVSSAEPAIQEPETEQGEEQRADFRILKEMLNAPDEKYDENEAYAIASNYLPALNLELESVVARKRLGILRRRASRARRG